MTNKSSQEIMNEIEKQEKDFSERDRRGFIWTKRNSKWCALREQRQERLECYKKELDKILKIIVEFEVLNLKVNPDSSEEDYEEASDRIMGNLKDLRKLADNKKQEIKILEGK